MATSYFFLNRDTKWFVGSAKPSMKRVESGKKDADGKPVWEQVREVNDDGLKGWKFKTTIEQEIPNPEDPDLTVDDLEVDVKLFLPDDFDPKTVNKTYVEFEDVRLWAYAVKTNAYISFKAAGYKLANK